MLHISIFWSKYYLELSTPKRTKTVSDKVSSLAFFSNIFLSLQKNTVHVTILREKNLYNHLVIDNRI